MKRNDRNKRESATETMLAQMVHTDDKVHYDLENWVASFIEGQILESSLFTILLVQLEYRKLVFL
jgi:hypothetical protein